MQSTLSPIRTAPFPTCLLCGSAGEALYRDLPDILFGTPGVWSLKRCANPGCALIWLDPRPITDDLHLAYQRYFTHGEGDGKTSTKARVRKVLYSGYKGVNRIVSVLLGVAEAKREMESMYLHDLIPGRLLDVGCGDGTFLNRMRKRGWTVDGVDFDAKAIANADRIYGLKLRHGDLYGVRFPDNLFDAVTLSHVIEHVPDPVSLLKEVRRIVKPGCRIVLTTPNSGSFGHEKYQSHWFGLDPPRHLQVFSVKSLTELATRAGFTNIEGTSTAANADIFLGGSHSIRELATRARDCHASPSLSVIRGLIALKGQHCEFSLLKRHRDRGEEAVLVCEK